MGQTNAVGPTSMEGSFSSWGEVLATWGLVRKNAVCNVVSLHFEA